MTRAGWPARERLAVAAPFLLLVAVAWAVLAYADIGSSWAKELSHHALLGAREQPLAVAFPLFVAGWMAMTAAMMLPTTMPLTTLFARASFGRSKEGALPRIWLFVGGYVLVWTLFGALAFAGDFLLHYAVERVRLLDENGRYIGVGVLALAGLYQFTPLKWACLSQCRSPMSFLMTRWRLSSSYRGALRMGLDHGVFCLGCCWALMLLMFAVGIANLAWMALLALVMYVEKVSGPGVAYGRVVGIGLLAAAAVAGLGPDLLTIGG